MKENFSNLVSHLPYNLFTMNKNTTERALKITRTFNAPLNKVWQAWTDDEQIKRWWGPNIFTCPYYKNDFRVGGKYLGAMRDPDGKDFWSTGTYLEIVPMHKLVMSDSFADEEGNVVPATYYEMGSDFPLAMKVTVTLEEVDNKTKMTLVHSDVGNINDKVLKDMEQGWSESFDKMAGILN